MQSKPCLECNGFCGKPDSIEYQNDCEATEIDVLVAYAYEDMTMQLHQVSEVEYRIERMEVPENPLFLN